MSVPFTEYTKTKDNFCLKYVGNNIEYLIQLQALRNQIEQEFKGLKLYISCIDSEYYNFKNDPKIICIAQFTQDRHKFAYVKTINNSLHSHPIIDFLKESNILVQPIHIEDVKNTNKCAICPHGKIPVKSLTKQQISNFKSLAESKGFETEVTDDIHNKGWVIGVENSQLYSAAVNGIKTTLISSGFGTNLYKQMFPKSDIIYPKT